MNLDLSQREDARWYFVCLRCDAKFFARSRQVDCPRCRQSITSKEKLIPPWFKSQPPQRERQDGTV